MTIKPTSLKLWHCHNARSLRPLWALEEMGLDYELELLPFPPRFLKQWHHHDRVNGHLSVLS